MANNRLYLKDSDGGLLMVAKSFGDGWDWRRTAQEMTEWLSERDMACAYGNTNNNRTGLRILTEDEAWIDIVGVIDMPSFSIWATEEELAAIKEEARGIDRSVSWYMMNLHRDSMGKNAKPANPEKFKSHRQGSEKAEFKPPPVPGAKEAPVKKKAAVSSDQAWRTAKQATPKLKDKK